MNHFSHICNGVMALDLCLNFIHNFVSAQYLEPKFVYALILTICRLGLLPVIFHKLVTRVIALD